MEIKNSQQTIITMDNKEFENLKELIKVGCTITKPVVDELDKYFPYNNIECNLYSVAQSVFHEDGWSEYAWDEKHIHNTHYSFSDERQALYEKIQNMYRTSIKMPEMFTDEELDEIKFRYGTMLQFEYAMYHLANAGQALADIYFATEDGRHDCQWLYELVDEVEGKNK